MNTSTTWTMRASTALLVLSLLSMMFLMGCQREPAVAPNSTTVDDNGSGGNGSDDPPGDDNGADDRPR
ncbi:MAG: hypothetical protein JNL43_07430 [Flavobacteriales bacterium]|nr:hypothetical protein [Flavobacteriales bacterium]HRH69912.1 hypothetical protein [Flavobacteriales bacterium]